MSARSVASAVVVVALAWVVAATAQEAGRAPGAGSATTGGATVVDSDNRVTTAGVLRLWRAYSTNGGRALLKVFRPEGSRLVLVGTSALELVPAGRVATFACSIPVARNDLVGVYCPDDNCVDRFADGRVLSSAGDVGTTSSAALVAGTGAPAVAAAGSPLPLVPSAASTELVVPVVGRTPGANGTQWVTSLEIFNTADSATDAALFFNRSGEDNTVPAASAQVTIPARGVVTFADLLGDLFAIADGTGSVDLVAAAPLLAHARVANVGSSAGSYGQLVEALPVAWAVGDDDTPGVNQNADILYLFELREDDEFRSNLGVTNASGLTLTVDLAAFSGTSPVGDGLSLELPPYSHRQVNRVLDALAVPAGTPLVRVNVAARGGSAGRFFAYLSRVDNGTGDAVYLNGAREPALP